jgi:hypothetical protein
VFLHGVNHTWKTFEEITRQLQQDLAPDARITHNEKLVGKSGAEHQCDVILRRPVGQLIFTCVIECKDHNDPVGSELMRAFIGKMHDLSDVHQGIMVSASGFTSDALKLAAEHRIRTYKLIDATHVRWRHEALLPIAIIRITLDRAEIRFFDTAGNPRTYTTAEGTVLPPEQLHVLDRTTNTYRRLSDILEELWDTTLDQRIPTPDHLVRTDAGRLLLYLGNDRHEEITVQVGFVARLTYHYNTISLASVQGFIDEQAGTLIPGTYETTPLDITTITKEWPSTTDKKQVPTPVDFFYLLGFFHRKPRTPQQFTVLRSREDIEGAIPI